MRELSLNILDIAQNSIRAKANLITVAVEVETARDILKIDITDNGEGMDKGFLKIVSDPFATTRETRKAGMGIPLFKQAAEITGGSFEIMSEKGKGTKVSAIFKINSIDRMPMGSITDTMLTLAQNRENAEVVLNYTVDGNNFCFDTREIKKELGSTEISGYEVLQFIREYLEENIKYVSGGTVI